MFNSGEVIGLHDRKLLIGLTYVAFSPGGVDGLMMMVIVIMIVMMMIR